MLYLRATSISILFLSLVSSAAASNVNQDFKRCASAAFQERGQNTSTISVVNRGLNGRELDHDLSSKTSQYRMYVTSKVSGEDLGVVSVT